MAARKPTLAGALEVFGQKFIATEHAPNINRYTPMPHQELFHKAQAKNRIATGGNRGGKTFCTTADDVWTLLRKHPYRQHLYADRPLRLRFIGVDFDRGINQTALPLFSQFIPPSALIGGSWEMSYSPSEKMLKLADTSTVSFMSYEQDPNKFQSVWLDHVHFDEEPPKPIWNESMMRLLDTGGTWTLSQTPVEQLEWVQDELIDPYESGTRPDIFVIDLDTRHNIHLDQEAVAALESTMTTEQKAIRLEGKYLSGSLVFPEFTRNYPNVIDGQEGRDFVPDPARGWVIYESMDYGFSNPTAWLWTAVHPNGSIVTFRALYSARVTIDDWAVKVKAMRAEIGQLWGGPPLVPHLTVGDPSIGHDNNGQTGVTNLQAYALQGINIATGGLVKQRSSNQNIGLDKMHTYLKLRPAAAGPSALTGQLEEPWWQIVDNGAPEGSTAALIDEVKRARKPKQTLKQQEVKNNSEEIRDKDNHAIDAEKYLFMMTHELRPPEFVALSEEQEVFQELREFAQPAATAYASHDEVLYATNSTDSFTPESYDYSSLEA